MRKDNNVNYNTKQSDVKSFSDFVPAAEVKELTKMSDSSIKNDEQRYTLPSNNKLKYNKVTKTWQSKSRDEVKDALKAAKKSESLKSFEEVILENDMAFARTVSGKEMNSENFFNYLAKDVNEHILDIELLKKSNRQNIDTYNILLEIGSNLNIIKETLNNRYKNTGIKTNTPNIEIDGDI